MVNAYLLHAKRVVYDLFFWSNQNFKRDFWFKISKRKTVIRISSPMSSFKNECLNFSQIEACFEYVVVNFLFQLIFIFPLFLGMVMYAKQFKTKEK